MHIFQPVELAVRWAWINSRWFGSRVVASWRDPAAVAFYDDMAAVAFDFDHQINVVPNYGLIYMVVPKGRAHASERLWAHLLVAIRALSIPNDAEEYEDPKARVA